MPPQVATLRVVNPFTQDVVCAFDHDNGSILDEKIARARRAFDAWRRLSLDDRIARVEAALVAFRDAARATAERARRSRVTATSTSPGARACTSATRIERGVNVERRGTAQRNDSAPDADRATQTSLRSAARSARSSNSPSGDVVASCKIKSSPAKTP